MIFTSLEFLAFFPLVVAIFYLLPNRLRWGHLLLASYYFYMAWKPAYAGLMFFETLVVYVAAIVIEKRQGTATRKIVLSLGVGINISLLFVFKYYNFFEEQLRAYGWGSAQNSALDLILPMGISFYTFHAISYLVDTYRGHVRTERHLGVLLLYIAYFPLLVAGPIARAAHLIPQLRNLRTNSVSVTTRFEYARVVSGLRLMLLGFFKKIVLADNLALIVQPVYASPDQYSGASALVATLAFAFQIFFDFSAYTDIARGASRVMGIELTRNFLRPYFATSIPEFWHRWHISLSTWFRDYVYIPLGGNRVARWHWFFNLWVVFVLCGFWHGANWTFLVWGALHGFYICLTYLLAPCVSFLRERTAFARHPKAFKVVSVIMTFSMVCWAWVMFRAETLDQGLAIWKSLAGIPIEMATYAAHLVSDRVAFSPIAASGLSWLIFPSGKLSLMPAYLFSLAGCYFYLAYRYRSADDGDGFAAAPKAFRWTAYFSALTGIVLLGNFGAAQFIYFQF